jgi:hypothetical protein
VVQRLLQDPRVEPSADDNYAIQCASENGHIEVVKRLLQDRRVDPSADDTFISDQFLLLRDTIRMQIFAFALSFV